MSSDTASLLFTEAELTEACEQVARKAFRRGRRSVLMPLRTLSRLNGSGAAFLKAFDESKIHRDHGRFSTTDGGKTTDSPESSHAADTDSSGTKLATPIQHAEHLLDGLEHHVPASRWERVKAGIRRVADRVYERLVLATPALLKVQDALTLIGDHPDDLKRFGYTPVTSGVAGHQTPDALRDATGIGGTLGAKIIAHVLSRAIQYVLAGHTPKDAVTKALGDVFKATWSDSDHPRDTGGRFTGVARSRGGRETHYVAGKRVAEGDAEGQKQAREAAGGGFGSLATGPESVPGRMGEAAAKRHAAALTRLNRGEIAEGDAEEEIAAATDRAMGALHLQVRRRLGALRADVAHVYGEETLKTPEWKEVERAAEMWLDEAHDHLQHMADISRAAVQHYTQHGGLPWSATGDVSDLAESARNAGHKLLNAIAEKMAAFKEAYGAPQGAESIEKALVSIDELPPLSEEPDHHAIAGAAIADVIRLLADELGMGGDVPDGETVAAALKAGAGEPTREPDSATADAPAIKKAWRPDDHPRGDDGRFIDAHDLHDAMTDPAKAKELRARVTKPEERAKLDAAIGAEKPEEGKGDDTTVGEAGGSESVRRDAVAPSGGQNTGIGGRGGEDPQSVTPSPYEGVPLNQIKDVREREKEFERRQGHIILTPSRVWQDLAAIGYHGYQRGRPRAGVPGRGGVTVNELPGKRTVVTVSTQPASHESEGYDYAAAADKLEKELTGRGYAVSRNPNGDPTILYLRKPLPKAEEKPTVPPADTKVDGKEPWEMTAREWEDARDKFKTYDSGGGVGHVGPQVDAQIRSRLQMQLARGDELRMGLKPIDPDTKLPRHVQHRDVIEHALAAGKPVPPEVLADYPDLAKRASSDPRPAEPAPAADTSATPQAAITHASTPSDSASAVRAAIERDKASPGPEHTQHVEELLTSLRAKHTDKELVALAKEVTGRGGRTGKQALDYLRADLTAVSRALESQRV